MLARFILTIELLPHYITLHSAQDPQGSGSSTLPGEGSGVPAAKERRGWVMVTLRDQGGLPGGSTAPGTLKESQDVWSKGSVGRALQEWGRREKG